MPQSACNNRADAYPHALLPLSLFGLCLLIACKTAILHPTGTPHEPSVTVETADDTSDAAVHAPAVTGTTKTTGEGADATAAHTAADERSALKSPRVQPTERGAHPEAPDPKASAAAKPGVRPQAAATPTKTKTPAPLATVPPPRATDLPAAPLTAEPRPAAAYTGPDPCVLAVKGDSPVARACAQGGVKDARKLMKAMLQSAKQAGQKMTCDTCHPDDDYGKLTKDGRDRFAALVKLHGD